MLQPMLDSARKLVWIESVWSTSLFGREYKVVIPKGRDARWVQILSLSAFNILGQLVYRFHINPVQILLTVGTCIILDFVLSLIRHRVITLPLSGLISALGITMMLRVEYDPMMYAIFMIAGILAIGGKHFITIGGKHVFNPSNFAIAVLLFAAGDAVTVTPAQWRPHLVLIAFIVTCGIWVVKRAKVLDIAAAFVFFEIMVLVVIDVYLKMMPDAIFLDIISFIKAPAFIIFTFHMITDPRTAPMNRNARLVYCAATVLFHWILIAAGLHVKALFLALLFTCSLSYHLDAFFTRRKNVGGVVLLPLRKQPSIA